MLQRHASHKRPMLKHERALHFVCDAKHSPNTCNENRFEMIAPLNATYIPFGFTVHSILFVKLTFFWRATRVTSSCVWLALKSRFTSLDYASQHPPPGQDTIPAVHHWAV